MRWFPRTFVAVAFVACRDPAPPLDAPLREAPVSSASAGAAAVASAAPSQAHDAAPANPAHPPPEHRLERLAYAPDGTLVVFANDAIVSYSREAEVARVPLASDEVAPPKRPPRFSSPARIARACSRSLCSARSTRGPFARPSRPAGGRPPWSRTTRATKRS